MSTFLTQRTFNSHAIRFENRDGVIWACLTDMAQATGKRVNDWRRLAATVEYVQALVESAGIPADLLIEVNESFGSNDQRGTWAVEEVAIDFAQWCNVQFRIWVNRQIKTLLSDGYVSISSKEQEKYQAFGLGQKVDNTIDALLDQINASMTDPLAISRYAQMLESLHMTKSKCQVDGQSQHQGVQETQEDALKAKVHADLLRLIREKFDGKVTFKQLNSQAILKRLELKTIYCLDATRRKEPTKALNKKEVELLFKDMHLLGLGTFDEAELSFTSHN